MTRIYEYCGYASPVLYRLSDWPSRDGGDKHKILIKTLLYQHMKKQLLAYAVKSCYYCIILFNHRLAGHFLRLRKSHDLKHCRSKVAKLASLPELAVIADNAKGNRVR